MALSKHSSPHGTVMAVSMMKDEAPYLLEWFAHHLAVGFTDILVYTNDCTDGTVEMLQRLEELGLGYHRHNVIKEGVKPQPSAIAHAEREPLVGAADWLMIFDADEFLCINHPSGDLDGMISAAVEREANGIVVTWRVFGSGFVTDWSRAPVTEQYQFAAPPLWRMGWGVKTLFNYDPENWRLGIHRPKIRNKHLKTDFPDTVRWLNGSGQPMEDYFKFRGWRSIRRTLGYDWAQLNHYAVKSIDSYAIRKFRGNVNYKKDKYNADYWALQDRNEVRDDKILRHAARRDEIMTELLGDPVLGRLHEAAMQRVEARLDEFKKTDAYAQLKEDLLRAGEVPITQVTAKPPKARDPLKIAALMSDVEKQSGSRPIEERRVKPSAEFGDLTGSPYLAGPVDLSSPVHVEIVENRALKVPADPRLFAPGALESLILGKFERRAARHIAEMTKGAARLLDASEGFGFIAQLAASLHPALSVMIQQERSDLLHFARCVAELNGLSDRVRCANGPLVMSGDNEETGARGLAYCLRDFRPDVLRISATGLTPSMAQTVGLSSLKRVLVLRDESGRHLEKWRAFLTSTGFKQTADGKRTGTAVFQRD